MVLGLQGSWLVLFSRALFLSKTYALRIFLANYAGIGGCLSSPPHPTGGEKWPPG